MASVAPPLPFSYHPLLPKPHTKHSLNLTPKAASLSFSPTHTNSLKSSSLARPTLLQEINNLCNSGNLSAALTLIQNNAFSSSQENKDAMGALLQACGRHKDVETGRKVHHLVSQSTHFTNDFVLNTLIIPMYSMCNSPSDSRLVFESLQRKNLFQWNALLSGYSRNQLYADAIDAFVKLISASKFKHDNWIDVFFSIWRLTYTRSE